MSRSNKPSWLKVRMPGGERYSRIKARARELNLSTVCEEAHCPNIGECWGGGTATFMVMGDTCTRGCRFCAVNTSRAPLALDPMEPQNLANAIAEMELDYVVITSVDRDDIADGGAHHFAACITAVRKRSPRTMIEVLIPDFQGDPLQAVIDASPDVIAHNIECVESQTSRVRDPRAGYQKSLDVLAELKQRNPTGRTKSSLMVGVGETESEMIAAMEDLRAVGCDFLTVGQYLQPSRTHLKVNEFVPPEQFERYEKRGLEMGFIYVASGPLVRSSYKAGEYFIQNFLQQERGSRLSLDQGAHP
jgi:lipoic acid synthetase